MDAATLTLSRYQLRLRSQERTSLPAFLGSTLRGAFGQSLKNVVCVMNHRDCEKCLVRAQCIYPYVFENSIQAKTVQWRGQQATPHPFILTLQSDISDYQFPRREWQKHDELIFELLLMGRAIDYLPLRWSQKSRHQKAEMEACSLVSCSCAFCRTHLFPGPFFHFYCHFPSSGNK